MPTGVYIRTEEYRQKQREAMFKRVNPGKNKSEATRKKIGDAQRGKAKSEEFKNKCRKRMSGVAFFKGHKHSPETLEVYKKQRRGDKHYNWKGGICFGDNKIKYSVNLRRVKIGFTPELFQFIFNSQNGKCAICNIILGKGMTLTAACADHCHVKNKPRGILCKKCNLVLGHANYNIEILKSAISYLEKWA